MSGRERAKGRRGESQAFDLLRERGWNVADLTSGASCEDGLCIDPDGNAWAVEVKNCKSITVAHRKQAMEQAKKRRARWMLMSWLDGTGCCLVQRQGMKPVVWKSKGESDEA